MNEALARKKKVGNVTDDIPASASPLRRSRNRPIRGIGNNHRILRKITAGQLSVSHADGTFERKADRFVDHVTGTAPVKRNSLANRAGSAWPEKYFRPSSMENVRRHTIDSMRSALEIQLQVPLDSTRVRTGQEAAALSRKLNAKAFAYEQDIYFGANQYRPHSHAGRKLLAHELMHVAQQASSDRGNDAVTTRVPDVQRTPNNSDEEAEQLKLEKSPEISLSLINEDIQDELLFVPKSWKSALDNFETQYDLGRDNIADSSEAESLALTLFKSALQAAVSSIASATGVGHAAAFAVSVMTDVAVAAAEKEFDSESSDTTQVPDFLTRSERAMDGAIAEIKTARKELYVGKLDEAFDDALSRSPPPREQNGDWTVFGEAARFFKQLRSSRAQLRAAIPRQELLSRLFQLQITAGFVKTGGFTGTVTRGTFRPSGTLTIGARASANREEGTGRWIFEVDKVGDRWTLHTLAKNPGGLASAIQDAMRGQSGYKDDLAAAWFTNFRLEILINIRMGDLVTFDATYVLPRGRQSALEGFVEFEDIDLRPYTDAVKFVYDEAIKWKVIIVTKVEGKSGPPGRR